MTHLRGRPRGSSSFPKGGGVSLGPGPAGRLKAVPWGWRSPVETPRLPRLQGPIRLGYLKRDPAPAPRPEGECVRVCVPKSQLKLQYFGHLMGRVDSLEKSLMLGGIGGKRRRGQQRMRWLDGITDSTLHPARLQMPFSGLSKGL